MAIQKTMDKYQSSGTLILIPKMLLIQRLAEKKQEFLLWEPEMRQEL